MTDTNEMNDASGAPAGAGHGGPKVALVTGGNKGIGLEVARQLASLGMTVMLAARDPHRCEEAVALLRKEDLDVHPVILDVTDQASVSAAAEQVAERPGRLDVLVNNAGISGGLFHLPSKADLDVVRQVFETNLFGVISVTNAMLPLLRRSPAGRVVNVTSGTASLAQMSDPDLPMANLPPAAAYPASKSALNMLTIQYAKELRPEGILVNAAAPGACDTDLIKGVPMKITRTAAQGAAIIVHLATLGPDGPTGAYLHDDGPVPW
ncbi:SDR family oxidoreductase [Sphaerisporangium dianthi]|uniref:SDR family oxidoreductase n=1 Tax=Sphaerisporangium dianthi TaxID=1436120 RepID=A0ABV9CMS2_9ACTN